MTIGFIIIAVFVIGGLTWWAVSTIKPKQKTIPYSENEPQTPESSEGKVKMKVKGINELIRQQEQTNKHLKTLIDDFFWFRIGIVGLLIIGAIGATGGFK